MTRFFLRLKKMQHAIFVCLQVNTLETIKQTKRRFRKEKKKRLHDREHTPKHAAYTSFMN